ncbi:hypothetical protein B0H19DRAFT_953383 [Mycena capillaripes]|nr:hypothetical protein B0H19DRAFT_953383 [Mycena capillaripes]
MFFTASVTLLLASLAVAQDYGGGGGSPPTTSTPAASSAAPVPSAPANDATHVNVDVAVNGTMAFSPANFNASNGTSVTFWFPKLAFNHSVTQSSFPAPCTYLAASGNNTAGFDSGLTGSTQFTIIIEDDTKPIWFHCKQITHCGLGMVGSINAPTNGSNTFDAFQAAAKAIGSKEVTETDDGPKTGGFNAVASIGPTATGSGKLPSTSAPSSGMRAGASVGAILLGAAMFVALA